MHRIDKIFTSMFAVWIVMVITIGVGWIKNIIHLISMENIDFSHGETIVRFIGIPLAPLGSIMGWFF